MDSFDVNLILILFSGVLGLIMIQSAPEIAERLPPSINAVILMNGTEVLCYNTIHSTYEGGGLFSGSYLKGVECDGKVYFGKNVLSIEVESNQTIIDRIEKGVKP